MQRHKNITMAALMILGLTSHVFASEDKFLRYGEVEDWTVYVDTEKKSCLIETQDALENVVQMGLTEDRGVGYVGIFTKADIDLKKDEKRAVAISLGENLYTGQVVGMSGNITKGYKGGYVLSDDPQFANDIAQQYEMVVFPDSSFTFVVDLTGTKKAIEMARECNTAQLG